MSESYLYSQALSDFRDARRKASLQDIFARLAGKSFELLSYEDVRNKLFAIEMSGYHIEDIPIDSIVGSVGRYTDFSRTFLPKKDIDAGRWARVMSKVTGLGGLPPIEVYKIGEVYFVLDGNHRVSVARQLSATHIQAYVTEVRTRVNLTADINLDGLIIKAEYADFLERTQFDKLLPDVNLEVTNPGQYPIIIEHIHVHRYYLGIEKSKEIPFDNAVLSWYKVVYTPIVEVIRERGILHHFPGRTGTDLYLWLGKHIVELEETLAWKIQMDLAADDLVAKSTTQKKGLVNLIRSNILNAITPSEKENGLQVGEWRRKQIARHRDDHLFMDLLVPVNPIGQEWNALEQAILFSKQEGSRILGLHVQRKESQKTSPRLEELSNLFKQKCEQAEISANLAFEVGKESEKIIKRSRWVDLVVVNFQSQPSLPLTAPVKSELRYLIRQCPRPILAVYKNSVKFNHLLLAFDGSPKAEEALYVSTYLALKWMVPVSVIKVSFAGQKTSVSHPDPEDYLSNQGVKTINIFKKRKSVAKTILDYADDEGCDLIVMGSYGSRQLGNIGSGSVLDQVLNESNIPVLICR